MQFCDKNSSFDIIKRRIYHFAHFQIILYFVGIKFYGLINQFILEREA